MEVSRLPARGAFRARRAGHPSSRPVALKVAQRADDPRFAREVGLLPRVPHPALPRLLDQGSSNLFRYQRSWLS